MSEPTQDQNLHLPSLVIKNFRGIDELTIPRLGRVTLLAGKNGVGKTTVLDAVRAYGRWPWAANICNRSGVAGAAAMRSRNHEMADQSVVGRPDCRYVHKSANTRQVCKSAWFRVRMTATMRIRKRVPR